METAVCRMIAVMIVAGLQEILACMHCDWLLCTSCRPLADNLCSTLFGSIDDSSLLLQCHDHDVVFVIAIMINLVQIDNMYGQELGMGQH